MVEIEYAKAIYDLAIEENKIDKFWDAFLIVSEATKENDFIELMTSPMIENDKKKKIISDVYKKLDKTFINFLYVLIDHNRFNKINNIGHEYRKLVRTKKNIMFIDIISAFELSDKQVAKIKKTLENKYNDKELDYKFIIKPDLIGGIQIISNGVSIDLSLKNSLKKIREEI